MTGCRSPSPTRKLSLPMRTIQDHPSPQHQPALLQHQPPTPFPPQNTPALSQHPTPTSQAPHPLNHHLMLYICPMRPMHPMGAVMKQAPPLSPGRLIRSLLGCLCRPSPRSHQTLHPPQTRVHGQRLPMRPRPSQLPSHSQLLRLRSLGPAGLPMLAHPQTGQAAWGPWVGVRL